MVFRRRFGPDFADAERVFAGQPLHSFASPRGNEVRFVTISVPDGRYVAVVWTWRGTGRRLISLRRARDGEIRDYRAVHG
jgi:uncharacterized DUF497 family protein